MSGIILIGFPGIVPFSLSRWEAASSSTSQQTVLIGAAFVAQWCSAAASCVVARNIRAICPKNGSVPIRRGKRYRVFNNYSQMTLQMKREALEKLNQYANETGKSSGTVKAN
jgi:hypothetical protein